LTSRLKNVLEKKKKKNDVVEKKYDALDIRFGLIDARDVISKVIAVVYGKIEFTHDGKSIDGYGFGRQNSWERIAR
jgi:hypothetical protein